MTSRRRSLVAPLVAELRSELLVAPGEEIARGHIELMLLEQELQRPPSRSERLAGSLRSRRTAALVGCACAAFASFGLSAAGAIPEPIRHFTRHITSSIAHSLGVADGSDTTSHADTALRPHTSTTRPPTAHRATAHPHAGTARSAGTFSGLPIAGDTVEPIVPSAPASWSAQPRPVQQLAPPGSTPAPTPTTTPPPQQTVPKGTTPPGFPSNWAQRAVIAADAQLHLCTETDVLDPSQCPQQATAFGDALPGTVHWSLLNEPMAGGQAVLELVPSGQSDGTSAIEISVYGRFQMIASYISSNDGREHVAYSGGIAHATMSSTFQAVVFDTGPIAEVPAGIDVSGFTRPSGITDTVVFGVLRNAITGPNVVGDPASGAVVAFDPASGLFTVTGAFVVSTPSADGSPPTNTTVNYTATLAMNGSQLQLLDVLST